MMQILTALRRTAAAGLVMTAALAMGTTPSYAGNSSQHTTSDPTGAVFSCANGDLTVTGGVVDETSRFGTDGDGTLHINYTITPHEVTQRTRVARRTGSPAPPTRRRTSSATNSAV